MKETAILINSSRGQVVNEKELIHALQNDKIAAAGIDVFEDEPLAPDSPLIKMGHKVLLAPHTASANVRSGLQSERVKSSASDVPNPINPPKGCCFHPRSMQSVSIPETDIEVIKSKNSCA